MAQQEFFINSIELIDIHGSTNIPTTLTYRRGSPPSIGNEALSLAGDRDDVNEDFKVDLGNQRPGTTDVRRFRCADGKNRSAGELSADFMHELLGKISRWLESREIRKGTNILVAEPLAMQEGLVEERWLANYRSNMRRILQGKGFENVEFLPEPFAVYQYYRYGEKHPLVAERRKHHALVIDFGGGTFDVCVIETTKEGDVGQAGRTAKPLSASSNPIGGFSINRAIAEALIRKVTAPQNIIPKLNRAFDLYRRWRKEGSDLASLASEYGNFVRHLHRLSYRVEEPKLALCRSLTNWSLEASLKLSVPVAVPDNPFSSDPTTVNVQFSAAELRSIFISKVWEQHLRPIIKLALQRGKEELSGAPVTVVLLSGGSANIRWLIELLRRDFGPELNNAEILALKDFQEVVSKGLAVECARRYYTDAGQGDFSAITYNRLCLILDPDDTGYQLKRFMPREEALPRVDIPGVLLPSASVLTAFRDLPMHWKVHLDSAPRKSLNYYFLRSSFEPNDIQNLQNVEEQVAHTPKNCRFDPDLTLALRVSEDGTATPTFIYRTGRTEQDIVAQDGRPFFLDMTTGDSVPAGKAYVGLDFGTSNTSVSFVNDSSIQVFERRAQERSWNELSDLAASLPYPLASPLAHYLCQTDPVRLATAAREFIESALTLAAYTAYQEYCTHKGRAETSIIKVLRRRSAGPVWGLFRECMLKLGGKAEFSSAYQGLLDPDLQKEIDAAVTVIDRYKHGKATEESANPLRVVQILANIAQLALRDNTFGMFQHVEKQRFGKKYEGVFRHGHGRPPFIEVSPYLGQVPFSNNECYILNNISHAALPLEPLILWEHCSQHPDLENGHCFMFDTNDGDAGFTYKAVQSSCTLKVTKSNQHSELAERLAAMFDVDLTIESVVV
jgi:hypothetical protein